MRRYTPIRRRSLIEALESRTLLSVTTFHIVTAQTHLTADAAVHGFALSEQAAGSLIDSYTGTVVADVKTGSIQFTNASNIVANLNADTHINPGNAPANYGGVNSSIFGDAVLAVRNLAANLNSGVITVAAGGSFPSSGETFSVKTGKADYDAPVVGSGTKTLVGASSANHQGAASKIVSSGGVQTLTIPISITINFTAFSSNDSHLTLTGQLVATTGTVATASTLAFAVQPTSGTAGKALSPAVKVNVLDASGKIVAADTSTVTISVSGPAGAPIGGTLTAKAVAGVATFSNLLLTKTVSYILKAADGTLKAALSNSIAISAGAAAKLLFESQSTTATAGKPIAAKVDVVDAFGNVVKTNTSTVTMSVSSPVGTKLGGTVTAKAVAGVATFTNLLLTKVDPYILKAADGTLKVALSKSITITPGAAAKLLFASQSTTATAGKPIAAKVDVVDAFGNVVKTNTSPVTMSVSSPVGAKLGGTVTAKAVAGVATFGNLLLTKADSYILKAVDGTLTAALSNSIKITAATAAKLVFTQQPITAKVGTVFKTPVMVAIEDTFGNFVLTNTSSIAVSLFSGPSGGVLSGTLSVHAVMGMGVATFSTLKLSKAGTYVIKASDGMLTVGKSKNVVVT